MNIAGYQRLTLIDFPGRIATTVFTVGCPFRCPFCHNPELVIPPLSPLSKGGREGRLEKEFFEFLKKRKGKLEGVCITGGEPTVQPDLAVFIRKVKKLGYAVKLDSNGTRPDVIKKLIDEGLLDYIAMDIKNSPKKYLATAGIAVGAKIRQLADASLLDRVKLSVDLIMKSRVPYEFRTTVVPGLHTEKDFLEIAEWIKGAKNYCLQEYREIRILDPNLKKKTKGKKIDIEKIASKIKDNFQKISTR